MLSVLSQSSQSLSLSGKRSVTPSAQLSLGRYNGSELDRTDGAAAQYTLTLAGDFFLHTNDCGLLFCKV